MTEAAGRGRVRVVRMLLGVAALIAVLFAFFDAVRDAGEVSLPSSGALIAAILVAVGAIVSAGAAWALLLGRLPMRRVMPSFAVAQLAKYLPGSIWQAVAQVLGAEAVGSTRRGASLAFVLHVWTQLVAAGLVMSLLLMGDNPWWLILAGTLGPLSLITLLSPVTRQAASLLMQAAPRRLAGLDAALPSSRDLWQAMGLGGVTIVAASTSFALLLPSEAWGGQVVAAFAAAWVIGFLAVPFPAGVGVRELILVAALGPAYGTAAVLTAAVLHRAVTIGSELLVSVVAGLPGMLDRTARAPKIRDEGSDGGSGGGP